MNIQVHGGVNTAPSPSGMKGRASPSWTLAKAAAAARRVFVAQMAASNACAVPGAPVYTDTGPG